MSRHVALQREGAIGTCQGLAGSRSSWLPTRGQVALRGVEVGLLGAILMGSFDATRFLLGDHRGQKLLLGALVLTAGVLGAHVLACMTLNRLVPPGDEARRTRRRVLSWLLEIALFPMFFLPFTIVLFMGPPVIRVIEALARP
jgi:hypothetical protein